MEINLRALIKGLLFQFIMLYTIGINAQAISDNIDQNIAEIELLNLNFDISKDNASNEFTSEILKQRLNELSNSTPFNVAYNATTERFIRLYLKTRKDFFSSLMDKAKFYFPIFEERLDKFNIPLELKYLAVVESALIPNAKSRVGATGLWQFMYHTGKEYGLKINSYVDERSDPIKATEAACQYLSDLYERFEDWDLALAAYNSGPGNVSKAIRRSGGKRNYWNIRQYLPRETRSYVPAFYTTLYLFEYGAEHQIHPTNLQLDFWETDTVRVTEKTSFATIAKSLAIDKELITMLNPQYKLAIIPRRNLLTLPKNSISMLLKTSLEPMQQKELPLDQIIPNKHNSYIVQEFDNLARIAKKFNLTISQLKIWNGLQTNFLIEDQRLVITDQIAETFIIGHSSTKLVLNANLFEFKIDAQINPNHFNSTSSRYTD